MSPKFLVLSKITFIESGKRLEQYAAQSRDMGGLDYSSWLRLAISRYIDRDPGYKLDEVQPVFDDKQLKNIGCEQDDKMKWRLWAASHGFEDFSHFIRSASYWFYIQMKNK